MSKASETRRLAMDWLREAARPSGAAVAGLPPPWVHVLLKEGLIRREALVAAPLFRGARAVRAMSIYKATPKGHALLAVELHTQSMGASAK